eukprot:NODE_171_length_14381_cov_0.662512.p2 type:complete len:464 gc:universal NODE_171_length_14381_cov_0.662512:4531-5922(+)
MFTPLLPKTFGVLYFPPSNNILMDDFSKILSSLSVNTTQLRTIQEGMMTEMQLGLSNQKEGLKMLPSYLFNIPTGNENGTYIALDLGGTNFRVVQVDLLGNGQLKTEYLKYTIPDHLKISNGDLLFDFIAECVKDFLIKQQLHQEDQFLGFTFSFPCQQIHINKAVLLHWAKGFTADGVEGKDVVEILHQAFIRKNVNIHCKAVINDTVGTLLAHAYKSPNSKIGVILGTGSNAAYIEKCTKMTKNQQISELDGHVLVNIEWGAFGDNDKYLPITKYDELLDLSTPKPKQHKFEKMVSGMYLGELMRLVMVDLIHLKVIFGGKSSETIKTPWSFPTKYLSEMESDFSPDYQIVDKILNDCHLASSTVQERQIIKAIGQQIGTRSARMAGAAMAGVLVESGCLQSNEVVVIAIDGSLFEYYPNYQFRIEAALRELLGEKSNLVKLELARDGSSVGAALGSVMAK